MSTFASSSSTKSAMWSPHLSYSIAKMPKMTRTQTSNNWKCNCSETYNQLWRSYKPKEVRYLVALQRRLYIINGRVWVATRARKSVSLRSESWTWINLCLCVVPTTSSASWSNSAYLIASTSTTKCSRITRDVSRYSRRRAACLIRPATLHG